MSEHEHDHNPVVGIDLGTTYSCIARWNGREPQVYKLADGRPAVPSIVYMQDSGAEIVGHVARRRGNVDPFNGIAKIKRDMGDDAKRVTLRGKDYSPVDVSAMIIKKLCSDVEQKYPKGVLEFAGAVVTHPHYFRFPQIARTQEAAEQAGLPIIRLLSEPVSAALDYAFCNYRDKEEETEEKLLVFDLGGGTFDVTVLKVTNKKDSLRFEVQAVGGHDRLGGTDFDEAFQEWVLDQAKIDMSGMDELAKLRSLANLHDAVIEAKEQLTYAEVVDIVSANLAPGKHLELLDVTPDQFNAVIEPYCTRIRSIVSDVIAKAGLRSGELDRTIMIGGSSRIPIMNSIVLEETGAEPWKNADPDLAVCRGAAFLAAMEADRYPEGKKEITIEEMTSHALGLRAEGEVFDVIIPANRSAPVSAQKIYTTSSTELEIVVYQGKGKKVSDEGVMKLKPIPIKGIKLNSDGRADVRVTFTVNDQQILFVKIETPGEGGRRVITEGQMESD